MKIQKLQQHKDSFINSINLFRITSEERQNYVKLVNFSPISAGFSHSGCVVENTAYMWGTNGINCALNRNVLQNGKFTICFQHWFVDYYRYIIEKYIINEYVKL